VALLVAGAAVAAAAAWGFDKDPTGKIAPGWTEVAGAWQVVKDATAPSRPNVLAQVSRTHTGERFNVAVVREFRSADVDISVAFKAVSGREDEGGGPVWRYRDVKNYYVARFNPLEDNFRVYKVVNGRRLQLGSANVKLPAKRWHRLRVTMAGSRIRCFLNGKQYLDVKDETFKSAGQIGLWTKADAVTYFDDLKATGK